MSETLVLAAGIYGGQSVGAKGQSWYGSTDPWFTMVPGDEVERLYKSTSCDRAGCIQIRLHRDCWMVALTRHYEARGQTTWRVARLPRPHLADWLTALHAALRAPATDAEFSTRSQLTLVIDRARLRRTRRETLPWLRGLESWATRKNSEAQSVLCLNSGDNAAGNATPDDNFARLLVCAARQAELDEQHGRIGPDYGLAVLPEPIAEREHTGFITAKWAAVFTPGPVPAVRHAELLAMEKWGDEVRGVPIEQLAQLPDAEFDELLWHPKRDAGAWRVPARLVPVRIRTADEWRTELEALWQTADAADALRRCVELGEMVMRERPEQRNPVADAQLIALCALEQRYARLVDRDRNRLSNQVIEERRWIDRDGKLRLDELTP
jgi:hypothetical protein